MTGQALLKLGIRYRVAELLPHGASMTLLDELLDYGQEHACCALTITPASLFFEEGLGVPSWAGIEYMAQTIGVYSGILQRQRGLPVQIGLLLGTRTYACARTYFTPGQRLVVSARQLVRDASGIVAFACELGSGDEVWARSELKAYQPDDIDEYLRRVSAGREV